MTTTPPTPDQVDALFVNYGSVWMPAIPEYSGTDQTIQVIVYGYTQNDGTQIIQPFTQSGDPTANEYYALFLQGLVAIYGAVTVREYNLTLPGITAALAADDTEQARINNQANWVAVP